MDIHKKMCIRDRDKILPMILVDILLLVVFGFIVYKAIQKATQNKVLFLEKEANDLVAVSYTHLK